jgi:hypothetical protein
VRLGFGPERTDAGLPESRGKVILYPPDPLDDEGKRFAPLLPKAVGDLRKPGSDMRAIVGAIRQVARSGGA